MSALPVGPVRRLVETRVVEGDRGLARNPGDHALGPLAEHARLRVAEVEPADDVSRARYDGHRQIASDTKPSRRYPAVVRICQHIIEADRAVVSKGGAKQSRSAGVHRTVKILAARSRHSAPHGGAAILVTRPVEEGADLGAAQLGRRIGHRLYERVDVQL